MREVPAHELPATDPMSGGPVRDAREVLAETIALGGRDVVDVGSGDGALVRWMAAQGARATGVEVSEIVLARARASAAVHGERHLAGVGQALPLPDAGADAVVFMQSLHHVPAAEMDRALEEAARVLRTGGTLYVQEPLASGELFELLALIDDETEVRAQAQAALARVDDRLFDRRRRIGFTTELRVRDLAALRDRMVLVDERRAAAWAAREPELRARFDAIAAEAAPAPANGLALHQPVRVDVMRRAGPDRRD